MKKVLIIGSVGLMTSIGLSIALLRVASTQLEKALSDLNLNY